MLRGQPFITVTTRAGWTTEGPKFASGSVCCGMEQTAQRRCSPLASALMASSTRLPARRQSSLALFRMTRCTIGSPPGLGGCELAAAIVAGSTGAMRSLHTVTHSLLSKAP